MSQTSTQDPAHATTLAHAAVQFIIAHQAEHLDNDQLVRRCCAHLMATTGITQLAAENFTMHALADVQAKHFPAYVDVNRTTSYVVRVVDPANGCVYSLTASDILQLAKAQNDAPPDPSHSIHACGRRAALT